MLLRAIARFWRLCAIASWRHGAIKCARARIFAPRCVTAAIALRCCLRAFGLPIEKMVVTVRGVRFERACADRFIAKTSRAFKRVQRVRKDARP